MSWTNQRDHYQQLARKSDRAATVTTKDSWLWFALWLVGLILTLGLLAIKMPWSKFRDHYATTIGPVQGYPKQWLHLEEALIVHECRHTTQAVFFGWAMPVFGWFFGRTVRAWVGLPLLGVVYALAPIPLLGALGRFFLELDADREAWRWQIANGVLAAAIITRARLFGAKVCGGEYLWSLIGGAGLFERSARRLLKKEGKLPAS